jgi:hypothetical protein
MPLEIIPGAAIGIRWLGTIIPALPQEQPLSAFPESITVTSCPSLLR